ncbi:hypothetical protein P3393_15480 [Vibrio parahaemolyticus]|nr:hypothetical protein [Vibrio parahaemolyticus]
MRGAPPLFLLVVFILFTYLLLLFSGQHFLLFIFIIVCKYSQSAIGGTDTAIGGTESAILGTEGVQGS